MHRSNVAGVDILILVVLLSLAIPIVQGDSPYSMPTFGVRWATRTIEVSVPSDPAFARTVVVRAAEIWNEAQLWFKAAYFPNGKVYTFIIGNRPGQVLIDFTDYWSVSNYCPSMPLGVEGCTNVRWNLSKNITQAIVFLDVSALSKRNNNSIFLVLHELGHALGLPDLPSSPNSPCPFHDLFCLYYDNVYPSTLDLYALHELAEGNLQTRVVLPPNLTYDYYVPPKTLDLTSVVAAAVSSVAQNASAALPGQGRDLQHGQKSAITAALFCVAVVFFAVLWRGRRRGGRWNVHGEQGGIQNHLTEP